MFVPMSYFQGARQTWLPRQLPRDLRQSQQEGSVRWGKYFICWFSPHIFVLLLLIFLSGNEKTEKDLWDVIISVLFVILHILCCIINSNTTDSFIFLVHFLYGLILYCFLKVHFNVLIVQLDPIYSFIRPSESFWKYEEHWWFYHNVINFELYITWISNSNSQPQLFGSV